jgi:hypothetical protein
MKMNRKLLPRGMFFVQEMLQNIKSVYARAYHLRIGTSALFSIAASGSGAILFWDAMDTNSGAVMDPESGSWNTDTTTNLTC